MSTIIKKSIFISRAFVFLSLMGGIMGCSQLGKNPTGKRLDKIQLSPNYKNGSFVNLEPTEVMTSEQSQSSSLWDFFFKKIDRARPERPIPSIKTDLKHLSKDDDILIWFGHSSYFMQIKGKTFLIDPVFSGHASPFSFMINSFKGTDIYSVEDFPPIDYLVITHDHYDHLDYETVKELKSKVGQVICGLGVGSHFEYWGHEADKILEGDWYDSFVLENGFTITLLPSRHFSGRTFNRNKTLWTSFALAGNGYKIFIGGDGGYGKHFKQIGKEYGPFDLAIMENGQYNESWKNIHLMPEETYQAALDLRAKRLLPIHSSKFVLSRHAWDEPLKRLSAADKDGIVVTPMIGEPLLLSHDKHQLLGKWWSKLDPLATDDLQKSTLILAD